MTPENVLTVTYFMRFLTLAAPTVLIIRRCLYILRYEDEPRRKFSTAIMLLGTLHFALFYLSTLLDGLWQPLDTLPLVGILATPMGQAMWGAFNGFGFMCTLYFIVDMAAQTLRLRRLKNETE